MNAHAAIVAALEALEVGDHDYAVAILLGALEDGPADRPRRCSCGAAFEWPGLLDAHRLRAGHDLPTQTEEGPRRSGSVRVFLPRQRAKRQT